MSTSSKNTKLKHLIKLTSAATIATIMVSSQAGIITSTQSFTGAEGFGGWNFSNVVVNVTDGLFDYNTGAYSFEPTSDGTYSADLYNGYYDPDGVMIGTTVMATIYAKDHPVGEPAGIKVINDDTNVKDPKPQNCIMATSYIDGYYLDSTEPQQTICSSDFQTHKRFKEAMLPSSVVDGDKGADLVFNVEADEGTRAYQVFQKINNWTDARLTGFTIEVGFGVGDEFQSATGIGVNLADLSISVPEEIWAENELATFSHGLFGAPDNHFPTPGFFDNTTAGYSINQYPIIAGLTDTLTATTLLGSNYTNIPPTTELIHNQFGTWLPNIWIPQGIFFDDDGNPATDAALVAWYGYNPVEENFGWMTGSNDNPDSTDDDFNTIEDSVISDWSNNPLYSMGEIDDLVNVGINYIVTIGDIGTFPAEANDTFTIRITPTKDTVNQDPPSYVGQTPYPELVYLSSDGLITLNPSPEFVIGSPLTVRVADSDLNLDSALEDMTSVLVSADGVASEIIELTEEGINRGVFVASLPSQFSSVVDDTIVTVTYIDLDDGSGGTDIVKTASSEATESVDEPEPELFVVATLRSPDNTFTATTKKVTITIENDKETLATGTATVTANGVLVFTTDVTVDPDKRERVTFDWTSPETAQIVNWEATVILDDGSEAIPATATTDVWVKGKGGRS